MVFIKAVMFFDESTENGDPRNAKSDGDPECGDEMPVFLDTIDAAAQYRMNNIRSINAFPVQRRY
jgi:hypothetical protein